MVESTLRILCMRWVHVIVGNATFSDIRIPAGVVSCSLDRANSSVALSSA
jgi:hypothetical protein